jgi:hypothetical protein
MRVHRPRQIRIYAPYLVKGGAYCTYSTVCSCNAEADRKAQGPAWLDEIELCTNDRIKKRKGGIHICIGQQREGV